jgi:hypothetical protein
MLTDEGLVVIGVFEEGSTLLADGELGLEDVDGFCEDRLAVVGPPIPAAVDAPARADNCAGFDDGFEFG